MAVSISSTSNFVGLQKSVVKTVAMSTLECPVGYLDYLIKSVAHWNHLGFYLMAFSSKLAYPRWRFQYAKLSPRIQAG